jgi:hypothetical protein
VFERSSLFVEPEGAGSASSPLGEKLTLRIDAQEYSRGCTTRVSSYLQSLNGSINLLQPRFPKKPGWRNWQTQRTQKTRGNVKPSRLSAFFPLSSNQIRNNFNAAGIGSMRSCAVVRRSDGYRMVTGIRFLIFDMCPFIYPSSNKPSAEFHHHFSIYASSPAVPQFGAAATAGITDHGYAGNTDCSLQSAP